MQIWGPRGKIRACCAIGMIILVTVAALIFWPYLTDPAASVHGDWGIISRAAILEYLKGPSLWDTVIDHGYFLQLYRFPLLYTHALLVLLTGYDFNTVAILLYPFPIIAPITCYLLCVVLGMRRMPGIISSLAYLFSPVVFLRLQAGHLPILMVYSLYPLCLALLIKGVRAEDALERVRFGLLCGILVAICGYYELRITLLVVLLMTVLVAGTVALDLRYVAAKRMAPLCGHVLFFSVVFLTFVAMSSFYLITFIQDSPKLPFHIRGTKWLATLSSSPILLTMSDFNSYLLLDYDLVSIIAVGLLAAVACSATIWSPKGKISWLCLLGFLGIAFLSKGASEPFGYVSWWMNQHVYPLSEIRDPLRYAVIGEIFFCLLVGFSLESFDSIAFLGGRTKKWTKLGGRRFVLTVLLLGLVVLRVGPIITGSINVYAYGLRPESGYINRLDELSTEGERIAWIPFSFPYSLSDQITWPQLLWGVPEATAFVAQLKASPSTTSTGHVLSLLGARYLVVPAATNTWWKYASPDREAYLDTIKSMGAVRISSDPEVYSINTPVPLFYSPESIVLVVASPRVSLTLLSSVPPGRVGFFFLDQIPQRVDDVLKVSNAVVLENGQGVTEVVMRQLSSTYGINAQNATYKTTGRTWTTADIEPTDASWANVFPSNLVGVLKGDEGAELVVPFETKNEKTYSLWVRALLSRTAGAISFRIDSVGLDLGASLRAATDGVYRWIKIGSIEVHKGHHSLLIRSDWGQNYIDPQVVIVPESVLQQTVSRIGSKLDSMPVLSVDEFIRSYPTDTFLAVEFRKTNPWSYDITVPEQARAVFSTIAYDHRWSLSNGNEKERPVIGQGMVSAFLLMDRHLRAEIFYDGETELLSLWTLTRVAFVLILSVLMVLEFLRREERMLRRRLSQGPSHKQGIAFLQMPVRVGPPHNS